MKKLIVLLLLVLSFSSCSSTQFNVRVNGLATTEAEGLTTFRIQSPRAEEDPLLVSSGSSHDLRYVFPALLAASKPYLGHSTGQEVVVTMDVDADEIAEIRG